MNESIPQLLNSIKRQTPATLESAVLIRIRERMRARLRARFAMFSTGTVLGLGIVVKLGTYLVQAIAQSGFSSYASLVFSGDGAVLKLWRELSLSLFESLPLVGVIGVLIALAFVIWTSANVVSNVRKFGTVIAA